MNRNTRIKLNDTILSSITKISDGVSGAVVVCAEIMDKYEDIDPDSSIGGFGVILELDYLGIYGSRIWQLYKDVCKEDIVKTIAVLRAVQLGMLDKDKLQFAIDNYGKFIDVDDIYNRVRHRLPCFSDALIIPGPEHISTVKDT